MNNTVTYGADILYSCLDFDNHIVGVKLLKTEDEYNARNEKAVKSAMHYCGMVRLATLGYTVKAAYQGFNCQSGPRVLGINPVDLKNAHGETWSRLGLYSNSEVSADLRSELTYLTEPQYGVVVGPLESFDEMPDVALCIVNPYLAMRIFQGYSYHYGVAKNIQLVGNQAICNECTARTIYTQDINLSLLCIGTRHRSGWGDDKLAVGIYKDKIAKVADGIFSTVNQMESDANKHRIEERLKERGIAFAMTYSNNYYDNV